MNIPPLSIQQDGPGIDLSNQPEGIAIEMSDPVADLEYARNAVTLVFDLTGVVQAQLSFQAMEYGDEPHAPPAAPFGDDANFDGVAVSADGVDWYEIQDLRHLRSDRFTAYDIDLNAAIAALGISYTSSFRIRFCQYDNMPAPMDGISIHAIELEAELREAVMHLPMDDNAATPTVVDTGTGAQDQTFLDPGGDPNTDAHSVPGKVGTALSFDGIDDEIDLGNTFMNDMMVADHGFAVAFWWMRPEGNTENGTYTIWNRETAEQDKGFFVMQGYVAASSRPYVTLRMYNATESRLIYTQDYNADGVFHHYVLQRRGTTFEIYVDGALAASDTDPGNSADMSNTSSFCLAGYGAEHAGGVMDDFRVYDRALLAAEIEALFNA